MDTMDFICYDAIANLEDELGSDLDYAEIDVEGLESDVESDSNSCESI